MALIMSAVKKNNFRDREMQDYKCDHFIYLDEWHR